MPGSGCQLDRHLGALVGADLHLLLPGRIAGLPGFDAVGAGRQVVAHERAAGVVSPSLSVPIHTSAPATRLLNATVPGSGVSSIATSVRCSALTCTSCSQGA